MHINHKIIICLLLVLPFLSQAGVDKSGVKPSVLSLPSGPGSIEGLGESFKPQLNSGTSSYSIPFALSPGRAGFTPDIALLYNSGNGNGPFGLGWKINLPYIQRQTDKGLPFYSLWPTGDTIDNDKDGVIDEYDEFDTLIYSEGEELVPVTENYWRLEFEGKFLRFEKVTNGWIVKRPDGVTLKFGVTVHERVEQTGRIFRWHLSEMIDLNGNSIKFSYEKLDDSSYIYLRKISYNRSGESEMAVVFNYQARPDILSDYRPRFELKTAYRCASIEMQINKELVRSYQLSYQTTSAMQPLSLLASVTQVGRDATSTLPSATFSYSQFKSETAQAAIVNNAPSMDLDNQNIDLLDINHDGLPDILDTNLQPHGYYLNEGVSETGDIQWSTVKLMTNSIGRYLGASSTRLADINGDGHTDLMDVSSSQYLNYFTITETNKWQIEDPLFGATFFLSDPSVKLLDVNNDKRIDVIQTAGSAISVWLNQKDTGWSQAFTALSPNSVLRLDSTATKMIDMNGDRLLDLVYLVSGSAFYYPNKGYGEYGEQVRFSNPPMNIQDPKRLILADINGDGRSDVIYLGSPIQVWLNLGIDVDDHSQAMFASPFNITTPLINNFISFRQADINGNGSTDILWNTTLFGQMDLAYIDFSPNEQPYQLKTISNGIGRTTTISYRSSMVDMVRDNMEGTPWTETIPFAVPVVADISVNDGLHTYTTEYSYHHGYYDGLEREFRGFANADQRELGDNTAPDLISHFTFNTGGTEEALKGKLLIAQTENAAGEIFYRETSTWENQILLAGVNGDTRQVNFPFASEKVRRLIEKGAADPVSLKWKYTYDDYGNLTRLHEYGRLDERWNDERVINTQFSAACTQGLSRWILNKPIISTRTDANLIDANKVAEQKHYYDGNTEVCKISSANLTKTEDWVEDNHYVNSVRNDYDQFGNITAIYDPLYTQGSDSHYREIIYDTAFKTFPIQEKIHVDTDTTLNLSAKYDAGFGVVTESTGFNDYKTHYAYDTFGRIISTTKPLDSKPTQEYTYLLAQDIGNGKTINYVETRQRESNGGDTIDSRKFFDGLGRHVMTRSEGEQAGQVVVSDTVQFNARKTAHKKYLPYFENIDTGQQDLLDYVDPTFAQNFTEHFYDALGREIKMLQPDGSYSQITYAPLQRTVKDEEQTKTTGSHTEAAMRYEEDGLQDKGGKGRLRKVTEIFSTEQQWLTQYRYDLLDNLTGYTDSQGNQKAMTYDGLSRKTFMNDPDRGVMHYHYDAASNLTKTIDAKNQTIQMAYDGTNRILGEYYTAATIDSTTLADVEYHYDTARGAVSQGTLWSPFTHQTLRQKLLQGTDMALDYDLNNDGQFDVADVVMASRQEQASDKVTASNTLGQLAWIKDTAGEEHYSFDSRGRKLWNIRIINDDNSIAHHFYTGFAYDSMDRITQLSYPDQSTVSYQYNTRGLLESIPQTITQLDYNPAGQNLTLSYANGTNTSYTYDKRLRLSNISSTRNSDNLKLQDLNYSYDNVSNITAITDGRSNTELDKIGSEINLSTSAARKFNASQAFIYDNLYRLTEAKNTTIYGTIQYAYDQIGNMTTKTANLLTADQLMNLGEMSHGGSAGSQNRIGRSAGASPGPHAITGTQKGGGDGSKALSILYDDNGNVTAEREQSYQWDVKDRLVQMSKTDTMAQYRYDYGDIRKYKVVKNAENKISNQVFYIDKFSEVRNGELIKYLYAGTQRVARSKDSSSTPQTFYLHDHLGSTNLALDSTAKVTEQLVNYPFGRNRLDASVSKQSDYRFTGKEKDSESGLQYFEARYLTPYLGKFNVVDPLADELLKDWLRTPMRLNMYSYGVNNPIRYSDPSGTVDLDRVISGSWKLAGGILSVVGGSAAVAGGVGATSTGIGAPIGIGSVMLGSKAIAGGVVIGTLGVTQIVGGIFESDPNKMKDIDKAADIAAIATDPVSLAAKGAEVFLPKMGMDKKTSKAVSTAINLMGGVKSGASSSLGILKATNKTQKVIGSASLVHSKAGMVINSMSHIKNEKTTE